jgi:hypothetical protein
VSLYVSGTPHGAWYKYPVLVSDKKNSGAWDAGFQLLLGALGNVQATVASGYTRMLLNRCDGGIVAVQSCGAGGGVPKKGVGYPRLPGTPQCACMKLDPGSHTSPVCSCSVLVACGCAGDPCSYTAVTDGTIKWHHVAMVVRRFPSGTTNMSLYIGA